MSSGKCEPNSNVAGPGVIGSFITTAILILFLSWWYMSRVQIRVKDRLTAERITTFRIHSRRLRKALTAAVSGFVVAQLVTGFALLAGTIREYGNDLTDKHAIMAAAVILLSMATHWPPMMAILRASGLPNWSIVVRFAIGTVELFVFTWFIWSGERSNMTPLWPVLIAVRGVAIVLWLCVALNLFVSWYSTLVGQAGAVNAANWGTRAVAFLSSIAILVLCVLIIFLKRDAQVCDLNGSEDNEMSFGQFATILMLASPVLSFIESLFLTEEEKKTLENEYYVLGPMPSSSAHTPA